MPTEDAVAADLAAEAAAAIARGDALPADDTPPEKTADELAAEAEAAEKAAKPDDENIETPEEKAEREAEEAEQANKKRVRIPLSRHEEMLNKARQREEALVARVQELERTTKAAPAERKDVLGEMKTKIAELQDKYEAHLFEGEKVEAKAVRAELETLREQYTDAKVANSSTQARVQTLDTLKYEAALAKVEADFPALNPDNEETFDEAKATEVAELLVLFQKNGLTRQAALSKAVGYVMGAAKAGAPPDATAETLAQKRAQEARAKAAEASRRQPPDATKVGQDNDKAGNKDGGKAIDVMKLSQAQFAKVDEETLSRLRGDTV